MTTQIQLKNFETAAFIGPAAEHLLSLVTRLLMDPASYETDRQTRIAEAVEHGRNGGKVVLYQYADGSKAEAWISRCEPHGVTLHVWTSRDVQILGAAATVLAETVDPSFPVIIDGKEMPVIEAIRIASGEKWERAMEDLSRSAEAAQAEFDKKS